MRPATPEQLLWFFFRAQGRIGRAEYALGLGVIYALNAAMIAFALVHGADAPEAVVLLIAPGLALTVALAVIMAKRCHDIGLPGTFFLLCLVPIGGIVWLIALAFLPGNPGPNAYGRAPAFAPKAEGDD